MTTQSFEIRGIITGNILKTVQNPAALIETEYGSLLYIGESDEMPDQMQKHMARKNPVNGNDPNLAIVEIPKTQDEVTKAFSVSGYALELYREQNAGVKTVLIETD